MPAKKIGETFYPVVAIQGDDQSPVPTAPGGRAIPAWDYRSIAYTGDNPTTLTYKVGGASGVTVATQTIAYDGNDRPISETWS
jgi:hypothetical protein